MGKHRKKIKLTKESVERKAAWETARENQRASAAEAAEQEAAWERRGRRIAAIVLLAAAFVMFAVSVVFAGITVSRLRNYETNFVVTEGTAVDYEISGFGRNARITLIYSYRYGKENYFLHDTQAFGGVLSEAMGTQAEIYVNPLRPEEAVKKSTAGDISIVAAVTFALAAFIYAISVAITGGAYKKRALCAYLPVFLLSAVFVLLLWLGLPHDGLGAVFVRMSGSIGYAVIAASALLAAVLDGVTVKILKNSVMKR